MRSERNDSSSAFEPNSSELKANNTSSLTSPNTSGLRAQKEKAKCRLLRHKDCSTCDHWKKRKKNGQNTSLCCHSYMNSKSKKRENVLLVDVCKRPENGHVEGTDGSMLGPSTYMNESYVRSLPPKKMSVLSSGALGHLITQVIEEENSSDLENERIL